MKKIILLHLTDFHYGKNSVLKNDEISKLISDYIKEKFISQNYDVVIALGGDLADKSNSIKYQYAKEFIKILKTDLKKYSLYFILCPGNHDIGTSSNSLFSEFNTFSREINPSTKYIYNESNTCIQEDINNFTFVAINSCYKGNKDYGFIDIHSLNKILNNSNKTIIILTHHHIIPILENEISTTRNSFDFLKLISDKKISHILHGHIHTSINLKFNDINIVGTGAILPEINQNYNNAFTIIDLDNQNIFQLVITKTGTTNKIIEI